MNTGGEAAEQIVRMSLEGFEVAAKITGAGAKNIAILLYSILKEEKKTKGKARLSSMLRSGKELKVFTVKNDDLKTFTQEAKKYGEVRIAATSREDGYAYVPKTFDWRRDADYAYITTNNTIYGTRYTSIPDTGAVPLVADMSSNILSEPMDVSRFGVIFAGAQKNIGPAGLCIVTVRKDLLGHEADACPKLLNWALEAKNDSMLNTPNTYGIYMAKLGFEWLRDLGGVPAIYEQNRYKAGLLYDYLDESRLFTPTANKADRSLMNVTFVTGDADKDAAFVKYAAANGLVNLKGHRSVGGMRASIYNAMPVEGVKKLIAVMQAFEKENA